jgi:hypothetical protein
VAELAFSLVLGEAYTPSIYRLNWILNLGAGLNRKLEKGGLWRV